MTRHALLAVALAPALLLSACVTTTTRTTTWGGAGYGGDWARTGRVESVRETVVRQEGNPGAGAVAGALIGGLLGSGGHTHYDRYGRAYRHGSAAGAVGGAVVGAVVGAAASSGSAEQRTYEVVVRFDDGGAETYSYPGSTPFAVGDAVTLTPQGLYRQ